MRAECFCRQSKAEQEASDSWSLAMIDEAGVGLRSTRIRDDLRPENRQYLKCAKEHADGTFSPTQLDPAEHTCLVHLFVLLCALAKKQAKLRSTGKPTCAHRRKSILVANESCIFSFGAAALWMLGNGQLSNKKPRFRQVLTPGCVCRSSAKRACTCCYWRAGSWSPFCFDITLRSLLLCACAVVITLETQKMSKRAPHFVEFNFLTNRNRRERFSQNEKTRADLQRLPQVFFFFFLPQDLAIIFQSSVIRHSHLSITVKPQIFVWYPFSYFWLETGSCGLIFVLNRASKQNSVEIQGGSKQKETFIQY